MDKRQLPDAPDRFDLDLKCHLGFACFPVSEIDGHFCNLNTEAMCDWELAQAHLRVCPPNDLDDGIINCSRCEKCVRTMIPIYALGKMEKFTTFEKPLKSNHDYLWWARKFNPKTNYVLEMFPFMRGSDLI